MLFRDIKQNYPVFILDKQELVVTQGKVISIGFPRMEMNPKSGKSDMVVDVTIEANGKTAAYAIPENLSVTYADNLILSTDQQGLSNEIEALHNAAKQFFAAESYQKKVLEKTPSLLAELNPIFREKQETEKRFSSIESSISEVKDLLRQQQETVANFIKKLES